ncbi:1,4-dihydroxy-2-naphthoate polyprenyltransferase [Mumia sp. zg.B21]|uniref:1,4-dihydroxy-2-naphthoate polyprenyltransferase n=1 Tax=Mumia sp. zg.B21 TaxID=2855447 RepID=UPI001C6DF03D|nr:1,4-dihydroxy-2-naphthoate polyprenyltransferase [Mumia sp. zg.B21]MBW9209436.1 1,4-dihydroxy-2-naphthoate polyprenyltransferase [Mumia sp. zg.B21]
MATASQWIEGARPRTLPAAVAPVVAGTGAALYAGEAVWWKAAVCLLLSLALQVGVNYANDYSDGVKGTDDDRVGPLRLVGSRAADAATVKRAALVCFAVGGLLGLLLAATSGWWLVLVGVAAIAAAWFYTGGSRPYGYHALGEVSVFVFFGLVAVMGTTYVQVGAFTWPSLAAGIGVGALACAILVANNLRDIPTDTATGKRTLAVVLGDRGTRIFYVVLLVIALVTVWWLASYTPSALLGLLAFPWALRAATPVARGERGLALVPTLRDTGIAELVLAVGVAVGLAIGG